MNEHMRLYISKDIPNIIVTDLIVIMFLKVASGLSGVMLTQYIYDRVAFLLIPLTFIFCQAKCFRYYQNTLCKIRFKNKNNWLKNYYFESMFLVVVCTLLFFILILFCDMKFEKSSLVYLLFLSIFTTFLFLLFNQIMFAIMKLWEKTKFLLISLALSLLYMFLILKNSMFFTFQVVLEQPMEMLSYIVALIFINVVVGLFQIEVLRKSDTITKYLSCFSFYVLCYSYFENIGYDEFIKLSAFHGQSSLEFVIPMIIWGFMMVILVYPAFQFMMKEYRMSFLFYAIRLKNRKQWFLNFMKKVCFELIWQLLINAFCYLLVFQKGSIEMFGHVVLAFLYILLFTLVGFLLMQVWKDKKILQYYLIFFLVFCFVALNISWLGEITFLRANSLGIWSLFILSCASLAMLNLYGLNHFDYY